MEVVAYILGAILILVNLGMVSFRIYIISNKQWAVDKAELVDGVEEKYKFVSFDFSFPFVFFFRYTMAIFSFYMWRNTMENFRNQIVMFGVLDIVVNTLIAISAMLGLIGIRKKIPVLVRIWAFGLACYLGYWACWIIILSVFAYAFSVSDEVGISLAKVNT